MTVCIAAACNNGERIVSATDGLLSMGDVAGEIVPGKILWFGDWQFMYAGVPARFALVCEEIEMAAAKDTEALSRSRAQETIRESYQKVCARLASFEVLAPFGMTMEQFRETGLASFGEGFHKETLQRISQNGSLINDQMLVVGWGKSPHSVMLYEVGQSGDALHTNAGFAAIGCGAQMAYTMLMLLGQARHRTLAETVFNVACAKFFSEKSSGLDVGQMTTMYVSKKRTEKDDPDRPCGVFVSVDDLNTLRGLWEAHLKPRMPDEARVEVTRIAARINNGEISARDLAEAANASGRINRKRESVTPEGSLSPQPSTADPLPQRPSQESPGGSDES